MSEPRCAHCRETKAEHNRRIAEFEMHMHLWQPSQRAWLADWHDCSICLYEYAHLCIPAILRDYVTVNDAIMARWFAVQAEKASA